MKPEQIIPICILLTFLIFSGCNKSEWKMLFNGKNLDGWRTKNSDEPPKFGWKVENGELILEKSGGDDSQRGGDIITRKKYSNFELQWEWKMLTKAGNSGVKYVVNNADDPQTQSGLGLEYQIIDETNHPWMLEGKMQPNDYHTTGACYELYAPDSNKVMAPLGEWNTSKIVCTQEKNEHWLNGKKILEFNRFSADFDERIKKSKFRDIGNFGKHESGHILLQDHGGSTVHFRNIKIKEL